MWDRTKRLERVTLKCPEMLEKRLLSENLRKKGFLHQVFVRKSLSQKHDPNGKRKGEVECLFVVAYFCFLLVLSSTGSWHACGGGRRKSLQNRLVEVQNGEKEGGWCKKRGTGSEVREERSGGVKRGDAST